MSNPESPSSSSSSFGRGAGAGPGAGSVSWCEWPRKCRLAFTFTGAFEMMLLSLCVSMMRWSSPDSSATRIRSFRTS